MPNPMPQRASEMAQPEVHAQDVALLIATNSEVSDWASASHMHTMVLITVTVIGVYFCYLMAAPFMPAITAAFALAVLFTPLQAWLERKFKNAARAAAGWQCLLHH